MVRLGIVMIMIRIVLAEQNTGAIGFLQQIGLQNDQMRGLALAIMAGVIAGIAASALTIKPNHLNWPIVTSLVVMIIASLMDAQSSPLTRASNMYFSQFLLGFSSAFFMAPAMLMGIGSVVTQPKNLVSFVVLFGMSQNLGGLIGSAILARFRSGGKNITPACWAISSHCSIPTSPNGSASIMRCLIRWWVTTFCAARRAPASYR